MKTGSPGSRRGGGEEESPSLGTSHLLPFVELALWSSNTAVKYSAVAGLSTLAKVAENKRMMGSIGALECLSSIVFEEENPMKSTFMAPNELQRKKEPSATSKKVKADMKLKRLAASTLADLMTDRENQDIYVGVNGVQKTNALLLETKSLGLQQPLVAVLCSLAGNEDYKKQLVSEGALLALFKAAQSSSEKCRLFAFHACKRLSADEDNQVSWGEGNLLEIVSWLKKEELDIKFHMIAMETLRQLALHPENATYITTQSDAVFTIAKYLDADEYDDDVRNSTILCLGQIAKTAATRPKLAIPEVLEGFLACIMRNVAERDIRAVRLELSVIELIADCKENAGLMSTRIWVEILLRYVLECRDRVCKRHAAQSLQHVALNMEDVSPLIYQTENFSRGMCEVNDSTVSKLSGFIVDKLSQAEHGRKLMRPHANAIFHRCSRWVEEPEYQLMSVEIAANLAMELRTKEEIDLMLPRLDNFMLLTKSKHKPTQEAAVRLLHNLSSCEREQQQKLVEKGIVWRMKSVQRSAGASEMARFTAATALKGNLKMQHAAIVIQSMIRGRIQRKLALEKIKRKQQQSLRKG